MSIYWLNDRFYGPVLLIEAQAGQKTGRDSKKKQEKQGNYILQKLDNQHLSNEEFTIHIKEKHTDG
jgi:predicted transposase YbfD/YdcC